MSISLALNLDALNTITATVTSTGSSVTLYRRVGGSQVMAPLTVLALTDGRASFIDTPPQKTLLTYYAVNELGEVSHDEEAVRPRGYSLQRTALNGDVVLGDMVFNTVDDDGTVWVMSDLQGWWSTPEASIPSSLRGPDEDGNYDSDGRYEARVLKFEGTFLPSSPENLTRARERLVSAINAVRRTQRLALYDEDPKYLQVRLTGLPLIETTRSTGMTDFSVSLRASDPIKKSLIENVSVLSGGTGQGGRTYPRTFDRGYGTVTAPSTRVIVNTGNYGHYPRIVIFGPVQTPRIENVTTNQFFELALTLSADQYLEIDMREKTVLLNGAASRRSALTVGSRWWQLAPGDNEVRYSSFTSQTGSHADIYSRSSWIG